MKTAKLNRELLLYGIMSLLIGVTLFIVILIDYYRMKSVLPLKVTKTTVDTLLGLYDALEFKLLAGVAFVWICVGLGLALNFWRRRGSD